MSKTKTKTTKARAAAPKDVCFTIMPFGGWFDDYYRDVYRPAIVAAGMDPHRADDLFRPSIIVNDIWAYTKQARIILADLTGKNPNVFYELGLAHALAKPAILVAESMDDVPFDLRALRVLTYNRNAPDWGSALGEKIKTAIGEVLKAPAEAVLPAFLDTRGAGPKPTLSPQEKEVIELRQQIDLLRDEVRRSTLERPSIGPAEARERIERLLADGAPFSLIMRDLEKHGAPQSWIQSELEKHRLKSMTSVDVEPALMGRSGKKRKEQSMAGPKKGHQKGRGKRRG